MDTRGRSCRYTATLVSGQCRSAIGPKVVGQHVLSKYFFIYIFSWWSIVNLRVLCGRSWEGIKAYVGGLGGGSGPMWAVLGEDQGPCGRSWGRIRAHVGGLGGGSGPMSAVLRGIKPKSGPNPSGEGDLGRKEAGLNIRAPRATRSILRIFVYRYPPDPLFHFLCVLHCLFHPFISIILISLSATTTNQNWRLAEFIGSDRNQ